VVERMRTCENNGADGGDGSRDPGRYRLDEGVKTGPDPDTDSRCHSADLAGMAHLRMATNVSPRSAFTSSLTFREPPDSQSVPAASLFLDALQAPLQESISSTCWPTFRSRSATRPTAQRGSPSPGKAFPCPRRNFRRQRCSTEFAPPQAFAKQRGAPSTGVKRRSPRTAAPHPHPGGDGSTG